MKIFLTTNELQRRVGISPQTLRKRLAWRGVQPDGFVVNGSKEPSPIYEVEKLPALREALTTGKPR